MKKTIYALLVLLTSIGIFISCSKQEDEDVNKVNTFELKGTVAYNLKTKKISVSEGIDTEIKNTARQNEEVYYQTVKYLFTCDKSMPTFYSQEELENYLLNNSSKTNGIFELIIDNEIAYKVQIINGEKFNEEIFNTSEGIQNKAYPCTYKGIKQCAIDSIHAQNWYEMALCIGEGLGCVSHYYIVCMVDNC